jgi:hypothetical protein
MIGFRKLLSNDDDPPIQAIVDSNLIPIFLQFLYRDDLRLLQYESIWAFTNITSGNHDQCKLVVDKGIIPILCKLINSKYSEVKEQVVWCLGNIAGDNYKYRNQILKDRNIVKIIYCYSFYYISVLQYLISIFIIITCNVT